MKRPPGEEPLKFQRGMRHNPTGPEKRLWSALRNRQVAGAKFRKQVWLGRYLVDFFCAEAGLAIEVDGDSHAHQQDYDEQRTAWLSSEGFRMVRFSNDDVMRNLEGVVFTVQQSLTLPLGRAEWAPPSPLEGEGI
ncbi:endonuclease domain-containing protein [Sphingomonas sp.]|jgi:very-short-patch-repair endonuclease|uniref:endonuclease domain-containing protein n=1 Tax=Sphingomonas sp. TaxID=28214 RepID=UPI002E34C527|nr:endonuclease domain-containing protein [Sphingomonas sp.]HEX4695657.1 endonuclease domain-containing protein [Sphingomonas sp.]